MKLQSRSFPLAALVACGFALVASRSVQAQTSAVFLGQIIEVPYNFCPLGFTETLGQTLPIQQYQALFALIGTAYGGNGVQTFQLPYIPPKTLSNGATIMTCIALTGVFPSRN
jgi:microcystin-dependent protein